MKFKTLLSSFRIPGIWEQWGETDIGRMKGTIVGEHAQNVQVMSHGRRKTGVASRSEEQRFKEEKSVSKPTFIHRRIVVVKRV